MGKINKTISVQVNKEVECDIQITQSDVITYIKNSCATAQELNEIIRAVNANAGDLNFIIITLEEELKVKVLAKAFKKYSLVQLQNLLNY